MLAIRRSQREVGDDLGPLVQVVQRAQQRARVAPSLLRRPGREGAHYEHVAEAHSHGAAQRLGLVEQGPGPQVQWLGVCGGGAARDDLAGWRVERLREQPGQVQLSRPTQLDERRRPPVVAGRHGGGIPRDPGA